MDLLTRKQYGARVANESVESEMQTNMCLIRAMATDLPPLATPHRSKKKLTTTSDHGDLTSAQPAPMPSSFDMRTSQAFVATSTTLQQSPTVKTRRQTQRSKRNLDVEEEEVELNDRKRFATPKTARRLFTSFQSVAMIDANDTSSPSVRQ